MIPEEDARWFAPNLLRARQWARLTQAELCALMERDLRHPFSQQTYSKIENGTQMPSLDVATTLARLTGTDLATLLRPPEVAGTVLELRRAARETSEAHEKAETWTATFLHCREELQRLLDAGAPGEDAPQMIEAANQATTALGLRLSLED